jgi:uncharacterized damage-inducible protein DinB
MDAQKELIAEFDRETAKTRKVLAAIPEGTDFSFKPHPKSMSLGQLAGHVSDMIGDWGYSALTTDKLEFPADHKFEPNIPASTAALLDRFDAGVTKTRAELISLPMEKWDSNWQFVFGGQVWLNEPKFQVFRDSVLNHLIHHRAQLGVYLRLIDAKLPGTYGPSADGN